MNTKSRLGNSDETLNLGKIAVSKLFFYYIANLLVDIPAHNTVAPDHLTISLVIPIVFLIFGFSALSSAALGFLAFGCSVFGLSIFFIPGLPAFH